MKRVLVAPLNWGLGHATRCIPIIRALQELGAEVLLASDGVALHLLQAEFPHLPAIELPSYRIRYDTPSMVWNIGRQLPRILWAIGQEHRVVERLVKQYNLSGILSDNRYGCFSRRVHSVLITHQLYVRVPFLSWLVRPVVRLFLAQFHAIWVPDVAEPPGLSGELSHGNKSPCPNVAYIGILTRMEGYERSIEYDIAVVLSGPEPQRTILEQRLLEQAIFLPYKFIFIQGKTQAKNHHFVSPNVEVVSFLTSEELNNVLMSSRFLISRSGYSSIMDLAALGKKAILIPTPGQTEQEYLANFLSERRLFVTQKQDALDIEKGLSEIDLTSGIARNTYPTDAYIPTLKAWLAHLS
ncbi:MAG: glycosyl transferase family 28 [Saprospiraceae bacterium]|nr:glycosyl transferase family 28 [Saprospiraceae bacterium]MDW8483045.1 glycosyltransferase [Saprospiraceae bacterium]